MFGYLTLFTGLALSAIAAWFAVEGIMAIFAGMALYGMIMGIGIEAAKVVGITWIYRNWSEKTKLKHFMIPFTAVMMLLTSMGIFGLLSKAHIEQTAPVTNNTAQIERLDLRIERERAEIADAEAIIAQLDQTVQVLVDAKKISHPTEGSRIVRINQQPQRDQLKAIIDESFDSIDEYEDTKLTLTSELNQLELEVGPVKYIAAIIYENPEDSLEEAVRIVIIAFIFVFDPMAILLLMAGNYTLMGRIGAAPVRREEELLFGEPSPAVTTVEQLVDNPTSNISAEEIQKALDEFADREKTLTPAEIAQRGMLQEMLQKKQLKEKVRKRPEAKEQPEEDEPVHTGGNAVDPMKTSILDNSHS
jgi:hypothetical protein